MSEIIDTRLDRAQGCLLGQLAGDTLGGFVEFQTPEAIKAKYPNGVREMIAGGRWGNIAGQPTDDSEMALALARTPVRDRRYNPSSVLEAYWIWWQQAWDCGSTIEHAMKQIKHKSSAVRFMNLRTLDTYDSDSNGSLMRCSPLGIFGAGQRSVWKWARQDSALTHTSFACRGCCAVFVSTIAFAVNTGADRVAVHRFAAKTAHRHVEIDVMRTLEKSKTKAPRDYLTKMGWVMIAFQNAFYQLLHAGTVEDGIADTISRGGDTDTNAAIAGALLGAVHGRQGIPDRWIKTLQGCRPDKASGTRHPMPPEYWPCDVLELAEKLLEAGSRG